MHAPSLHSAATQPVRCQRTRGLFVAAVILRLLVQILVQTPLGAGVVLHHLTDSCVCAVCATDNGPTATLQQCCPRSWMRHGHRCYHHRCHLCGREGKVAPLVSARQAVAECAAQCPWSRNMSVGLWRVAFASCEMGWSLTLMLCCCWPLLFASLPGRQRFGAALPSC